MLAQHGLRRTEATCTVLALFWHDPHWHPSHTEVEAALAPLGMALNRVTLYRLLDRLAAAGLLERHTDTDSRTWRFALAAHHTNDPDAPRFECDACHRQFRVSAASHIASCRTVKPVASSQALVSGASPLTAVPPNGSSAPR